MKSEILLFSRDIPQANSVFRLFEIIELVDKGRWRYVNLKHELGITYRQAQYYKTATEILGLISYDYLTDIGEKFIGLSELQKRVFMKDLILDSLAMKVYLKVWNEDKNKMFEEFKKYIPIGELSDTTIKRRLSTLEKWKEYCENINVQLNLENPHIITIEKDEHKTAKARLAHENLVEMMKNLLRSQNSKADVFEDPYVDLIYDDNKDLVFFEMKSITEENKGNQLKKALGQLIFYKNLFGMNGTLVVVLDQYFDDIDYLIDDPIHIIWREGNKFESDKKTKKELKMIFV